MISSPIAAEVIAIRWSDEEWVICLPDNRATDVFIGIVFPLQEVEFRREHHGKACSNVDVVPARASANTLTKVLVSDVRW